MATAKPTIHTADVPRPRLIPSARFTLALLVFYAFIVQYAQRVNLPIGIVCMVNRTGENKTTPHAGTTTTTSPLINGTIQQLSKKLQDSIETTLATVSESPDSSTTVLLSSTTAELSNSDTNDEPKIDTTQPQSDDTTGALTDDSKEATEAVSKISSGSSSLATSTTSASSSQTSHKPKIPVTPRVKGGIFNERQFFWTQRQQQYLLAAYWAGYMFTQIPGGWLATTIGAKWVYAGSLGTSSVATLILTGMYAMSDTHVNLAFFLRFVVGLAHGVLFPASVALWSLWAAPSERSTLVSIGFCGTHLGTSLTTLIGGVLCDYTNSGWMYLFFFTSAIGLIWVVLWVKLTSNSPQTHPRISPQEREFISHYTGSSGKKRNLSLSSIPWKNIIHSKPLIALVVTQIANLFGLFFFLTNFPKVLNEILKIEPKNTGFILSLGYLLTLLTSLFSGIATDRCVQAKTVTLTQARKISNGVTSFVPAVCMFALCFCNSSNYRFGVLVVLLFLAATGLGYGSGYVVNYADIVPAYSGVIFGIANTFGSLAGVLGNLVAGEVVKKPDIAQWRKLYILFGIIYIIGGVTFVLFGSAVPRKWARFDTVETADKLEKSADVEAKPTVEINKI